MNTEKLTRVSLWVTSPFNLLAAYVFAFPTSAIGQMLGFPAGSHQFYSWMSASLIGLFGFVYAWLAIQTNMTKSVLCIGAIGKTLAVSIAWILCLTGSLSPVLTFVISGDLVFAALWFYYIQSNQEKL